MFSFIEKVIKRMTKVEIVRSSISGVCLFLFFFLSVCFSSFSNWQICIDGVKWLFA